MKIVLESEWDLGVCIPDKFPAAAAAADGQSIKDAESLSSFPFSVFKFACSLEPEKMRKMALTAFA